MISNSHTNCCYLIYPSFYFMCVLYFVLCLLSVNAVLCDCVYCFLDISFKNVYIRFSSLLFSYNAILCYSAYCSLDISFYFNFIPFIIMYLKKAK